jgi:hypothetical protein
MVRSRQFTTALQALALVVALQFGSAKLHAATVFDTTGSGDLGHIIQPGQAAASSFTLTQAFSNVTITADLTALGSPIGGVFLMTDLGPTADIGDLVAGVNFSSIVFIGNGRCLYRLNLAAGDYALVVANGSTPLQM